MTQKNMERYEYIKNQCELVLELEPNNIKALFNLAQYFYIFEKNLLLSKKWTLKVLKINSQVPDAKNLLQLIEEAERE